QYYGSALSLYVFGKLFKVYGWNAWYPLMVFFALNGALAMWLVMRKQRLMQAKAEALAMAEASQDVRN
ncbi:MAG: hypothetical protein ACK4UN_00375, partial [Limisphaerales bacterium]